MSFEFERLTTKLRSYEQRLDAIERYAASGRFINYAPTLTGSSVNPTLGTGAASDPTGRWARWGDLVYARGDIRFGTAGTAAGTGNYQIGLPVTATDVADANTFQAIGRWRLTNGAGSSAEFHGVLVGVSATFMTCRYPLTYPTGTDTTVGAAAPWGWAANYRIEFSVLYEAKP